MLFIPFQSIDFTADEALWAKVFAKVWPAYRHWFLKEGAQARPGYLSSKAAFAQHFPELVATYDSLCDQAGGGDLSSRFLSMYCPPPYMSGCSQLVWTKSSPMLIRNYDYSPRYFEGMMIKTNWLKPVIGVSDCVWGLLDGMNADGLCASLTFGGRKIIGKGFGIPLLIRYCLETCSTTKEAIEKLKDIPVHMAYNVTLVDANLEFATIYFIPGSESQVTVHAVGTNHQEEISWPDYARMTQTVERRSILEYALTNPFETRESIIQRFFEPPLFNSAYEKAFGTLYTAIYEPVTKSATLLWQGKSMTQSFAHFESKKFPVTLKTSAGRLFSL